MREFGVRVEGGFVNPFRMNIEGDWTPQRFEKVNAEAAGFGTRGREDGEKFFAELLFFSGERIEADEGVEGHGETVSLGQLGDKQTAWVAGELMDRIVVATALVHGMPLVSADGRVQDAGLVQTIW